MLGSQHGPIVVPFEPEQSLLYTKCSGEHTGGERMPQDDMNFFDDKPEKLQLIYDWIHFGCFVWSFLVFSNVFITVSA